MGGASAACSGHGGTERSEPNAAAKNASTKPLSAPKAPSAAKNKEKNSYVIGGDPHHAAPAGRWGRGRPVEETEDVARWQKAQMEQLEALGYVSGSQKAEGKGGVRLYTKESFDGYNFYVSGHAPVAVLMDMKGKVVHRWRFDFEKAWPKYPGQVNPVHSLFWRRAHLLENGDLLAIFEGLGMIKIDRDSKLIWKSARGEHHDLEVLSSGDIYVLTRKRHVVPTVNSEYPIIEDFMTHLDADGQAKRHVSMVTALENSRFAGIWNKERRNKGDIFHTNTMHVIQNSIDHAPAFKKGRVLTSFLELNALAVVDLEQQEVVWAKRGDFRAQHDPQIVGKENHLMLFDNRGGQKKYGRSRILEFVLPDMMLAWVYQGTPKNRFFTYTCGTAQRLPGGTTLITETDNGRAFEVTSDGRTVWEFYNPHRAGPKDELVASLFEVKRIPKSYVKWLKSPK